MIEQTVLIGLSAWRLAHFFIFEDGPFALAERIRQFVGVKPGPIEGFLPTIFSCMACMTVWMVGFSYLLWQIEPLGVIMISAMAIALIADRFGNG